MTDEKSAYDASPTPENAGQRGSYQKSGSHHFVSWTITEGDAWAEVHFHCTAPADDFCRTYCARSECEDGCEDIYGHKPTRKASDTCNLVDWLEDDGSGVEDYAGKPHPCSDGPIVVVWDGDRYQWWYEDNGVVVPT